MKKLILILSVFLVSCYSTELVNVKAVVLSHNTSSTDYGSIHYNSIIKLENGKYLNKEGMDWFSIPIGDTVYYCEYEYKTK